jgi:hypothetical protein
MGNNDSLINSKDLDKFRKNWKQKYKDSNKEKKEKAATRKKENLEKTLQCIQICTMSDGIKVTQLAKMMGEERKTVGGYVKILKEKGLVIVNPTTELLLSTDPAIIRCKQDKAIFWRFAEGFLDLFNERYLILGSKENQRFITNNYKENKPILRFTSGKVFEPDFRKEDHLEKLLFEFSNRIGSFITYLILYHFDNSNLRDRELPPNIIQYVIKKNIEIAVDRIVRPDSSIYDKFIDRSLEHYRLEAFDKEETNKNNKVLVNCKFYNDLCRAFLNLYPTVVYEFEKMLKRRQFFKEELKNVIPVTEIAKEEYVNRMDIRKKRSECDHEYEEILGLFGGKFVTKSSVIHLNDIDSSNLKNPFKIKHLMCIECGFIRSNSDRNDSRKHRKKKD